ncbi:MAG: hypothetical protein JXA90_02515, partial [Planctomycetes bacterium]|nr:hypothetical protein [Planctomycetota bacterium]
MKPISTSLWLLSLGALSTAAIPAGEDHPPVESLLPADTVIALEIQAAPILERLLADETIGLITGLPLYPEVSRRPDFVKLRGFVQFLEGSLGIDWKTGVRKLLGGTITLALGPGDSRLLVVDTRDADLLERLDTLSVQLAQSDPNRQGGAGSIEPQEHRGVAIWSLNPEEAHCRLGSRLVVAGRMDDIRAFIDRRADAASNSTSSLDRSEHFARAMEAVGDGAVARLFVNLDVLKQQLPVQSALDRSMDPLAGLLLAGATHDIRHSSWIGAGLYLDKSGLRLEVSSDAQPPRAGDPASFSAPASPRDGALPFLEVPRRIAAISLYRDLAKFYSAKEDLFPERTSGLIFFENMMAIFFSGRNFAEEVL